MKPILLQMQAFGPFASRQEIDFRSLGAKTFFLIHGPTGSGKTSILDGMCFALFGDSSGEERKAGDLRSQHAAAGVLTQVAFEFALGDKRYRVRRTPEQARPARRGGGTTRQAPEAEIVALEGEGGEAKEQPLASGWERVTRKVVELLGFESRQFRQVIVLPQGRFFEFLKAGSQEREKILQVLFGTELYRRMEEALKRAADDLQRQARECDTQRITLLQQAQASSVEALQGRQAEQATELATLRAAAADAAIRQAAAQQKLQQVRQVAERFVEHDAAQAALFALQQQAEDWARRRIELDAARRASALAPYEEALRQAGRVHDDARGAAAKAEAGLANATSAESEARAQLTAKESTRPDIERLGQRLAELQALHARVDQLEAARVSQQEATRRHTRSREEARAVAAKAQAARDTLAQLQAQLEANASAAAPADALRLQVQQLQEQQKLAQREALVRREMAQAEQLAQERTKVLEQAQAAMAQSGTAREETLRRWLASQAARIAHRLQDGEACPVCGSVEHPAPAQPDAASASDEDLQSADKALEQAGGVLEQANRAWAEATQALAKHAGAVEALESGGARRDANEIAAELAAASAALRTADAAARTHATLKERLPGLQAASIDADKAVEGANATLQADTLALNTAQVMLEQREAEVPRELATRASLQAAADRATQEREALATALEGAATQASRAAESLAAARVLRETSTQAAAKAEAALQETARDFTGRTQAAGFADADAYRSARREPAAIEKLQDDLTGHERALAAATDRAQRASAAVQGVERPELAAAEAEHLAVHQANLQAVERATHAQAALDATSRFLVSLQEIEARHAGIEQRYRVLRDVADKANGQNGQRMSFQRYVLATLLDEVLAATTQRLRVMSRGRYEMRRRLQSTDARAAGGLDLEVFDHYTGHERGVQTLSGGESFLASLALALGLSDVVQAYAGGIRLDAIFVDEGFGTLDPEALDFAIRTLKDLQQAGRVVGIISHVAELKGWIDARLEVRPSQAGSEAAFAV